DVDVVESESDPSWLPVLRQAGFEGSEGRAAEGGRMEEGVRGPRWGRTRWSVALLLGLFATVVVYGVIQDGERLDAGGEFDQRLEEATKMVENTEAKVDRLHDIHRGQKRHKIKDGKTVWKFLYEQTDDDLISFTTSEEEEANLNSKNLNIITEIVQIIEAKPDTSLGQVAVWFLQIARAWPRGIEVSKGARDTIEGLLKADFDGVEVKEDEDMKTMVEYNGTGIDFNEGSIRKNGTGKGSGDARVRVIEAAVRQILDADEEDGGISGKHARKMLREAVESPQTLAEWRKILIFTLCVAEAAPLMQEYRRAFNSEYNFSLKRLVISEQDNLAEFEEILQKAAKLLEILEKGCEEHPRINTLIRASFFEYLLNSDDSDDVVRRTNAEPQTNFKLQNRWWLAVTVVTPMRRAPSLLARRATLAGSPVRGGALRALASSSSPGPGSEDSEVYIEDLQRRQLKSAEFYERHAQDRKYFYHVDLQGRLFLEETMPKNVATSLKSPKFLDFFWTMLRPNNRGEFAEYPFISPCGKEMNFIRPADTPVVFDALEDRTDEEGNEVQVLVYAATLSEVFDPTKLVWHSTTDRLYYPVSKHKRLVGSLGLIRSRLAVQFSETFTFGDDGEILMTWKGHTHAIR
ncbi:UPF0598 protein C8orf82, partial [Durusdinium trenchii]